MNSPSQLTASLDDLRPRIAAGNEANFPLHDKDSTSKWVKELPQRNAASTAVELYKALPKILALSINPDTKKEIWDILYPVTLRCCEALIHTQLTPSSAKAVSLGQALLKQTYEGWKMLAYEFSASNGDSLELITQCLQRACHTLSMVQFNSLTLYLQQPGYLWHDLHKIYRLAAKADIANTVINDEFSGNTSIRSQYIKLNMLACTRPHTFSNYELKFVFSELDHWSALVTMTNDSRGALFAIPGNSNGGPGYADNAEKTDETLFVNTSKLVSSLQKILAEGKNDSGPFSDRTSRRIIKQLIRQWGEKISRQETHLEDKAKITLTPGLKSSLCALASTDSFESFLRLCGEVNRDASALKMAKSASPRNLDAWEKAFDVEHKQSANPDDPIVFVQEDEQKSKPIVLLRGMRNNTSINGSCVELVKSGAHQVLPGEVVAVNARGSVDWQVGLVRWKHVTPSLNTLCGLQFPGKKAVPVAVRGYVRGKQVDKPYMPAIIFTKKNSENGDGTLICQPLRFRAGDKLHVLSLTTKYMVELTEEIETTENAAHFYIKRC